MCSAENRISARAANLWSFKEKKKRERKEKKRRRKWKGQRSKGMVKMAKNHLRCVSSWSTIEGWTTVSKLGIIWGVELDGYFKVALESGSTRNPRTSVRYHSPQWASVRVKSGERLAQRMISNLPLEEDTIVRVQRRANLPSSFSLTSFLSQEKKERKKNYCRQKDSYLKFGFRKRISKRFASRSRDGVNEGGIWIIFNSGE